VRSDYQAGRKQELFHFRGPWLRGTSRRAARDIS
jgi:hypothetical protein